MHYVRKPRKLCVVVCSYCYTQISVSSDSMDRVKGISDFHKKSLFVVQMTCKSKCIGPYFVLTRELNPPLAHGLQEVQSHLMFGYGHSQTPYIHDI